MGIAAALRMNRSSPQHRYSIYVVAPGVAAAAAVRPLYLFRMRIQSDRDGGNRLNIKHALEFLLLFYWGYPTLQSTQRRLTDSFYVAELINRLSNAMQHDRQLRR